jgi:hypothetical protein
VYGVCVNILHLAGVTTTATTKAIKLYSIKFFTLLASSSVPLDAKT